DKDKYLQLYDTTSSHIQQCVRIQKRQFHIIDKALYKLFLNFHSQNVPVSQNILKTKAHSIYEQLKDGSIEFPSTFEASNSCNKMKILSLEMDLTNETGNNDMNELEDVLEELEISYNCIKLSAKEYVNMDDKLQTMDTLTEESVVRDILKEQGLVDNKDSDDDEEEEEKEVEDE
ncbi:8183_t:CDS:2, partial [Cetraspora pellucida]